jgi:hypothetical protein
MATNSQRDAVLEALKEPHTIVELQNMLGGNYHSIYRVVKELMANDLVLEQPFKRAKKNVYVVSTSAKVGVIMIHTKAGARPLGMWTKLQEINQFNMMRGAIAYLWRRSYHKPPVGQPEDVTRWQGDLAPIEVKTHVRQLRDAFEAARTICDQLLIADVWSDSPGVHEQFGDIPSVADVLMAAELFEAVATGKSAS